MTDEKLMARFETGWAVGFKTGWVDGFETGWVDGFETGWDKVEGFETCERLAYKNAGWTASKPDGTRWKALKRANSQSIKTCEWLAYKNAGWMASKRANRQRIKVCEWLTYKIFYHIFIL